MDTQAHAGMVPLSEVGEEGCGWTVEVRLFRPGRFLALMMPPGYRTK